MGPWALYREIKVEIWKDIDASVSTVTLVFRCVGCVSVASGPTNGRKNSTPTQLTGHHPSLNIQSCLVSESDLQDCMKRTRTFGFEVNADSTWLPLLNRC